MSSVSSEDGSGQQSQLCGSYSLSADISESESCCSFSCRRFDAKGLSSSMPSSPLPIVDNFGTADSVMLPVVGGKDVVVWDDKNEKRCPDVSEFDMMKERFAKLLLGEDMSGAGKGVCSALTISNAITNLSASVFGELWRLEPLPPQKKAMWCREMEWFLCVTDLIVEFVPTVQQFPGGGGTYEVMTTRPRSDLHMNLPALKKLDSMLIAMLDGFHETEFWYVDRGIVLGDPNGADNFMPVLRASIRQEEKWWLPCPQISPSGLSEDARKKLQQYRDCANQILKAAMAINSSVLAEMEIPNAYLETLPKSGKTCLGEVIYHYVADEQFSSQRLLECLDLSSEHHTSKVVNRIEAALHVWKQKNQKKYNNHVKPRRPIWGGQVKSLNAVITEKNNTLAQRAETLLQCLRLRFPELPQTALDMTKIQYNKDIGQSILESYSRVMESLAFNIMARIDDVLYADDAVKGCAAVESTSVFSRGGLGGLPIQKRMSPSPFSIQNTPHGSPFATPTFCSSPPLIRSPGRMPSSRSNIAGDMLEVKSEKQLQAEFEKVWLCSGNVSGRIINGNASEKRVGRILG